MSILLPLLLLQPSPLLQEQRVMTPAHVARLRAVTSMVLSPDGERIAYTLSVPREPLVDDDGGPWSELHVVDLSDRRDRTFVGGKAGVSQAQFSKDGKTLFFVEKRASDKFACLYGLSLDGGEARRAVELKSAVQSYTLSPDGKRAAVIAVEPEDPAKKQRADKGFQQEIYEEDYRHARVYVVDLFGDNSKAAPMSIHGAPPNATAVAWSPIDDRLALALSPSPLVDDEMMNSRVHIVDSGSGLGLSRFPNPGKLGQISWSPDASWIAMVSAASANDTAAGRILVAPSSGGELTELLQGYEGHVERLSWLGTQRLGYVAAEGVWSFVGSVGMPGSGLEPAQILGPGGAVMSDLSAVTSKGTLALLGSTSSHPPEVHVFHPGESAAQRVTRSNPALDGLTFALQEVVRFKARDGLPLEGVLIRPLDEQPGKRYPLIVNVHGGPEACQSNGWLTGYSNPGQVAAARGFAVLHLNYRGSTGRGVAFAASSQGDPAGKEFDDLIDGIDYLVESGLVDSKRVGVTGGSYGGYATAWLSTAHSDRIAAGVMFVGISDKISKVGTTDIANEEFLVHSRKRPWDDWNLLLERSPIFHAGKCRTPLLILHGKDDPRVNPGQSRELFRHLKLHNQAPVRLVLYPGEGHGNRKAASRFDYNLRQLQWMEHYLKGPGGEKPAFELDYAAELTTQTVEETR